MLSVGGSRVHSVLVTLLYLLVVVAAVASIPSPLRVGRRARRSNYADNNRERDKRAAKCLFHISSLRYDFPLRCDKELINELSNRYATYFL